MPVRYHEGRFPPQNLLWEKIIPLLGPTSAALARYDGLLASLANPKLLLSPLGTREAVLSSKIEGTQATMGEVLRFEAGNLDPSIATENRDDIGEVLNYRRAILAAEEALRDLPLSQRVLRLAHRVLLEGVRGEGKAPGEYRAIPVWIGSAGCKIEEARFLPISAEKLPEAMSDWERALHAEVPDLLVQLAILHAEFEAIHPFLDGNGRLGRMLIPLYLWSKGLIRKPMFYMSEYLERNRDEYYDRLLEISKTDDWTSWVIFFLRGVKSQAELNTEKAQKIRQLYEVQKPMALAASHSQYAVPALDWIFARPIFKASDFVESAGIPAPSAKRLVAVLRELGILKCLQESSGRRAAVYAAYELLNIAEGRDEF